MATYSIPSNFTSEFRDQTTLLMDTYYRLVTMLSIAVDMGYIKDGGPGPKTITDDDLVAPTGVHDITAQTFYAGMGAVDSLGPAMTPEIRAAINAMRR